MNVTPITPMRPTANRNESSDSREETISAPLRRRVKVSPPFRRPGNGILLDIIEGIYPEDIKLSERWAGSILL